MHCRLRFVQFRYVPFSSVTDTAWTIYTLYIALYFAL